MALSGEVGELLEHFQWLTEQQSRSVYSSALSAISKELADVQIYLLRLADKLGIDLEAAVHAKIEENAQKYPADRVMGSASKYTEY